VKIQPEWVVTPGKQTNKETNKRTFHAIAQVAEGQSTYILVLCNGSLLAG
jgi:hypothetical protein